MPAGLVPRAARALPRLRRVDRMGYPAVELLTALLVAACFLGSASRAEAFVASFFCVVLVTVSATDL